MKIIVLCVFLLNCVLIPEENISIEIKFDTVKRIRVGEYHINGRLIIHNKSDKIFHVPKSFNLGLELKDALGNEVDQYSSCEEVNLINSTKKIQILPQSSETFLFTDRRLSDYYINLNTDYFASYILYNNQRGLKLTQSYYSNAIRFQIPND